MGCYNMHCGVTGTPIREGDSVVMFILEESKFCTWDENISSPAWIVSLPIYGKYDDYGGIDEISISKEDETFLSITLDINIDQEKNRINNNDIPMMFVHQGVYEEMKRIKAGVYESTKEEEYSSFDFWQGEREKRRIKLFDQVEKYEKIKDKNWKECSEDEFDFQLFWKDDWNRYFGLDSLNGFWKKLLPGDTKLSERYYDEVVVIEQQTTLYGYRIQPSLYGNQDINTEDNIRLLDAAKDVMLANEEKYK